MKVSFMEGVRICIFCRRNFERILDGMMRVGNVDLAFELLYTECFKFVFLVCFWLGDLKSTQSNAIPVTSSQSTYNLLYKFWVETNYPDPYNSIF